MEFLIVHWEPVFCNNMDEPGGHYAKRNKPKTNTAWYHLCVESMYGAGVGREVATETCDSWSVLSFNIC